jgi:hypothetical protein
LKSNVAVSNILIITNTSNSVMDKIPHRRPSGFFDSGTGLNTPFPDRPKTNRARVLSQTIPADNAGNAPPRGQFSDGIADPGSIHSCPADGRDEQADAVVSLCGGVIGGIARASLKRHCKFLGSRRGFVEHRKQYPLCRLSCSCEEGPAAHGRTSNHSPRETRFAQSDEHSGAVGNSRDEHRDFGLLGQHVPNQMGICCAACEFNMAERLCLSHVQLPPDLTRKGVRIVFSGRDQSERRAACRVRHGCADHRCHLMVAGRHGKNPGNIGQVCRFVGADGTDQSEPGLHHDLLGKMRGGTINSADDRPYAVMINRAGETAHTGTPGISSPNGNQTKRKAPISAFPVGLFDAELESFPDRSAGRVAWLSRPEIPDSDLWQVYGLSFLAPRAIVFSLVFPGFEIGRLRSVDLRHFRSSPRDE